MTPGEKRALARAATPEGFPVSGFNIAPADVACIEAHEPALLVLLWNVVYAAEHGPQTALMDALNALYAHIGYEP